MQELSSEDLLEKTRLEEEKSWLVELEKTLMPQANTPIELHFDPGEPADATKETMQRYAPILTCGGVLVQVEKSGVSERNAGQKRKSTDPESPGDIQLSPGEASQNDTQSQLHCPWHALTKLMDIALHIVPAARRMY